jgi:hypothetical protein
MVHMMGDLLLTVGRCLAGDEKAWKVFVRDFASLGKKILANAFGFSPIEQDDVIQNNL